MSAGELKLNKAVYEKKSAQNKRSWRQYKRKPFDYLINLKKGEAAKQLKHPVFSLLVDFTLSATFYEKWPMFFTAFWCSTCFSLCPRVFHVLRFHAASSLPTIPLTQLCECCHPQEILQSPDHQSKTGGFWELHVCGEQLAGEWQLHRHRQRPKQWVPTPKQRAGEAAQMRRRHCCRWDCSLANWEILKRPSWTGMQQR